MANKFEEALYLGNGDRVLYSVEQISSMRKEDNNEYNQLKDHLFCPECELPHLVHHSCTTKSDYFSANPHEQHEECCSFFCNKATKTILENVNDRPDLIKITQRLDKCLEWFIDGIKGDQENPVVIDHERDRDFLNMCIRNNIEQRRNYYIPRKRLIEFLDEDCTKSFRIFYGEVYVRWNKSIDKFHPHKLGIFHIKEGRWICSVKFTDNVYSHLPAEIKTDDLSQRFRCLIAFYAKMNADYDPNYKVVGNTFYSSVIPHSKLISFRNIVPVDG